MNKPCRKHTCSECGKQTDCDTNCYINTSKLNITAAGPHQINFNTVITTKEADG